MIPALRLPAALLAAAIGGVFVLAGLWYLNALRAVTFTSVRSPGRVEAGVTEVVARVQPVDETLTAPLSGERCVGYVLREAQRGEGVRSLFGRRWTETATTSQFLPFYLADGSGRVLVRPTPAAGDGPGTWPGDPPDASVTDLELAVDASETVAAGDLLPGDLGDGRAETERRYTEWCVAPGDVLYVLGRAETDGEGPPVVANDGSPFVLSETPQWRTALVRLLWGVASLVVGGALLGYAAVAVLG